jgi:microtubule-associated protein 1
MKKVLMIALTVLISVAFVTVVFAQAPAGTTEKKTTTTTTETTKSKHMTFKGEVTSMDTAAKMMTVKGEKSDITFDVSSAEMKGEAKAGDKVSVKYMEKDGKMVASSVAIHGTKTTKTKVKTETTTTTPAE